MNIQLNEEKFNALSEGTKNEIKEMLKIKHFFNFNSHKMCVEGYEMRFSGHGSLQNGTYGEESYGLVDLKTGEWIGKACQKWTDQKAIDFIGESIAKALTCHVWQVKIYSDREF